MHTVPTPTPSRGTPVEADEQPEFVDDAPTRPEPLVGALPIGPEAAHPEATAPPSSFVKRMLMRLRKQWPYALVLLTMAIGIVRIVQYHWKEGSAWIGGALLVAAALRAVLPPRVAGMVAVRGRFIDVLWCVGLAACIWFIAYTLKA